MLPGTLAAYIRQRIGASPDSDIAYILLSDTEDRLLRVFFPTPSLTPSLVHIGFRHHDYPGALSAITPVLLQAKFNVLTSLLRKKNRHKNTWEAVLEYRGTGSVPQIIPGQTRENAQKKLVDWMVDNFVDAVRPTDIDVIKNAEVCITSPEYPRSKVPYEVNLKEQLAGRQKPDELISIPPKLGDLLRARLDAIQEHAGAPAFNARQEILKTVMDNDRPQPCVFLS